MTPWVFVAVALAGGAGAACRLVLDGVIRGATRASFPWGTIVINLSGSWALGLLVGLLGARLLPAEWVSVLGTGFLGGYTTFSTASLEVVRLLRERRVLTALSIGFGVLAAATAAAGLGMLIGSSL